jgi:hypothetical protein
VSPRLEPMDSSGSIPFQCTPKALVSLLEIPKAGNHAAVEDTQKKRVGGPSFIRC